MKRHTASPSVADSITALPPVSQPALQPAAGIDGTQSTPASDAVLTPTDAPDVSPDIDEAMIGCLVDAFYTRAREDAILGPVFDRHVDDWPTHLARIGQFWASVLLSTGAYTGSPMQRHAPLPIDATHFQRWLTLFEETAARECPPAAAQRFIEAAKRMARSLQLARAPLPPVRPRPASHAAMPISASRVPSNGQGSGTTGSTAARIAALRALLPEPGDDAK
ncbi:group III truncated hemoglobin [Robbsia sp. KACC 23696]|uniref:group III truncated hemoglobin n=1 Tax=Robbsia sp. KACC 23696 TaxID=3149231 RepID=UPI00325B0AE9